jgi:hypothetical protein
MQEEHTHRPTEACLQKLSHAPAGLNAWPEPLEPWIAYRHRYVPRQVLLPMHDRVALAHHLRHHQKRISS